ncbi:MAG: hypothetical protein K8S98_04170 [Planctomycetes bacterium]|nr:hypothetical protein [Planctomycetota bacterium]
MPTLAAAPVRSIDRSHRRFSHGLRALAHTALLLLAGCDGRASEKPVVDVAPMLRDLEEAFVPVSDSSTSDVKDRALTLRRNTLERLRAGPPELGRAAWERFQEVAKTDEDLRIALLDVASHCDPATLEEPLAHIVTTYGPDFSLHVRTNAVRLFADVAPQKAYELLTALVREPHRASTYPPQETLLDCWIVAGRKAGTLDERLLADVAIGISQPADARYRAIEELGHSTSPIARDALELILTESGSDGYLRRKAAQAAVDGMPQADACALLERVADHEVDRMFLLFLADMIQKNCP